MKFSKFSGETVAELLVYLSENEEFASLKTLKAIEKRDVVEVLRELSGQLHAQAEKQPIVRKSQVTNKDLGSKTTNVIAKLTPDEENRLLKSFKID